MVKREKAFGNSVFSLPYRGYNYFFSLSLSLSSSLTSGMSDVASGITSFFRKSLRRKSSREKRIPEKEKDREEPKQKEQIGNAENRKNSSPLPLAASPPLAGENVPLAKIIALQCSSGMFRWDSVLEQCLGLTRAELFEKMELEKGAVTEAQAITALVVTFLEQRMPGEKNLWELLVEKSRIWLKQNVAREETLDQLYQASNRLMKN